MNQKDNQASLDRIFEALTDIQAGQNIRNISFANDPNLKPIIDKINEVVEFLKAKSIVEDITVLKEAESNKILASKAIENQYRNFDTLLSSIPDSLVMLDAEGQYLYVNRATEDVLGLPLEKLIGKKPSHLKIFPKESLEKLDRDLETVRGTRSFIKCEGTVVTPIELRNFEYHLCPILDDSGTLTGFTVSNRDVTDRTKVEQSLQSNLGLLEQERKLRDQTSQYTRSLIEASLDPLVTINAEGNITDVNEATIKVTGVSRESLIGSDFSIYFVEPEKAREGYKQVFAKGFVSDYPLTIRHRNGNLTAVLYNASVYKDTHGIVLGVFAAARDVTAQRQAEKLIAEQLALELILTERIKTENALKLSNETLESRVLERTDELNQAVQIRNNFISIASHELKTPLTSLMLQAQLRKRNLNKGAQVTFTSEQLGKMFDTDEKQLERITHLIDDMLDISRISTGKLSISLERFDLCELVQELVERTHDQFETAGCPITVDVCEPVSGNWDQFRIEQVIMNLLTNAMRYGGKKPISLQVKSLNGKAQIIVRDQGLGIAKENHERIFQMFERAISENEVSGLGLGLYIASQILKSHQGTIRLESELGQGATFFVELPTLVKNKEALDAS